MHVHLRHRLLAGAALLLLASPAGAADPPADRAGALERDLRAWLSSLLGPRVPLGPRPFQVTPEGDGYRVAVPLDRIAIPGGWKLEAGPITVLATPAADGMWTIAQGRLPTPVRVSNPKPPPGTPKSWALSIGEQDQSGTFDPTLTRPFAIDGMMKDYSTASDQPGAGASTTHIDLQTSHSTYTPVAGGRLDMRGESTGENLLTQADTPAGPVKIGMSRLELSATIAAVAPDQFGPLLRATFDLVPRVMAAAAAETAAAKIKPGTKDAKKKAPAPAPVAMTAADRDTLRRMITALSLLASGVEERGAVQDMVIDAGGHGASIKRAVFGFGATAPEGRSDLRMSMSFEGIDSPDIPDGPVRDYLPKRVAFAPHLSGVPASDVWALMLRAVDLGGKDDAALGNAALAVLAKGPLRIGIDDLAIETGPAVLTGQGGVDVSGPDKMTGEAEFRATGIDALMKSVAENATTAPAGAALIFLKGIGQTDGDALVWKVLWDGKALTVNGTDLSAMIPTP